MTCSVDQSQIISNLAFVFPGQGSQKVGMLAEMAERYPVVKSTFDEASTALHFDLWSMVQNGEQEALNLTENTQPILLTASTALWRVWCEQTDKRPAIMAGHSLGEFSALVAAESLQFGEAVKLVRDRGRFMQTAVPVGVGAMAAVLGLDDDVIIDICARADGVVEAVNFNSPGQVVIAGEVKAVDAAIELCKEAGAKRAMPLPVSAPFHTSLMRPAGEQLEEAIATVSISKPIIPVVHNVHARSETDPENIRALLVAQIYSPVKWVSCVNLMLEKGVDSTLECGPGKVLSGLSRRIKKTVRAFAIEEPKGLDMALEELV